MATSSGERARQAPEQKSLEEAVQEALEVSPTKARELSALLDSRIRVYVRESFSGPLPPPHILGEYERLSSGLLDRIVAMAERQGEHRRELEKVTVAGNTWMGKAGVLCGTGLGLAALGVIILAILYEAPLEYLGGILFAVAALVGSQVYTRRKKSKEAERRLSRMQELFEGSMQPRPSKSAPPDLRVADPQSPRADS